jgi:hypothetical protein
MKKLKEKLQERGSTSGTYLKTVKPWTDADDIIFRQEVESRYRDRTPPQDLDEKLDMQRVHREEMEVWALRELGKPLPEIEEWIISFILWYRRMIERNRVHMRWLDYCLCGAKGKLPPIRSDIESEITCQDCKNIFSREIETRRN